METLRKEFWKHVATVGGPADISDVYLKWAANKSLNFETANLLWGDIDREIHAAFGKKIADNVTVEITGDSNTVKEMLEGGNGGILETAKDNLDIKENEKPVDKKTLMDSLGEEEGEEEEGNEIPPLAGEETSPEGNIPPNIPPMGAGGPPPGAGGPPQGIGGPPPVI